MSKEIETFDDRLAELEKVIMDYYMGLGYQYHHIKESTVTIEPNISFHFKIEITSLYKDKTLEVFFINGLTFTTPFSITCKTTKEMFDKAFEFFSLEK